MDRNLVIVIGVAVLAVIVVAFWLLQRRRSLELRRRFGPEYEELVRQHHDPRKAERELESRERRVAKLDIRPLSRDDAARFTQAWEVTQRRFVDDPNGAVMDADRLVSEVMTARGYPLGDFEQRAADISVDHPAVVTNYRAARAIATRRARGESTTEDLRQALVHYRALFADLLEPTTQVPLTRAAGGRS